MCNPLCICAHGDVCECECGGANHSAARREWQGYCCEVCGLFLGWGSRAWTPSVRHWVKSKRYLTKQGKPQVAYYCDACDRRQRAWLTVRRAHYEKTWQWLGYDAPADWQPQPRGTEIL